MVERSRPFRKVKVDEETSFFHYDSETILECLEQKMKKKSKSEVKRC
jgi:hypothetical protein